MLNICVLIGRLGKDPETSHTTGGKEVTKFNLATASGWGEKQTTEWTRVVTWDKLAIVCAKFLHKGSLVAVAGRKQTRSWEKDGVKQYATEVVASEVKFLDQKPESGKTPEKGTPIEDDDSIPF